MSSNFIRKIILACFILVPLLSSIISTVHLVDLFSLGNPSWISITIAIAIEIGSIASFLTLSILSRLNKSIVWSMFIILFIMQIIGNTYFSYDWVTDCIAKDPNWLNTFKEMMDFFIPDVELKTTKMILSMLIGIPIPLISVFLLKSIVDYIGVDKAEEPVILDVPKKEEEVTIINEPKIEEVKIEEVKIKEPLNVYKEDIIVVEEPIILDVPKEEIKEEIVEEPIILDAPKEEIIEEPKKEEFVEDEKPDEPEIILRYGHEIHSSQIR